MSSEGGGGGSSEQLKKFSAVDVMKANPDVTRNLLIASIFMILVPLGSLFFILGWPGSLLIPNDTTRYYIGGGVSVLFVNVILVGFIVFAFKEDSASRKGEGEANKNE